VTDDELARGLAAREHGAMEHLVELHHASVYRFLRHLTRRVEDAEDLAQLTLIRAVRGASRYDGRVPLRSWLCAIAFREFTKFRRLRPWLPLIADRPAPEATEAVIEAEALLAALARLPANSRAVFLLHHVEEMPVADIAASLAIPEGTVKSRLYTARQKLRILLAYEEANYVPEPCEP
jgi:RNA polymerase sigma-70 factor (ECF subfamily)